MTLLFHRAVKRVKIEVNDFADHSHRQTAQYQTGTVYRMTVGSTWLVRIANANQVEGAAFSTLILSQLEPASFGLFR